LRRQLLTCRAQLAASEAERVETWTKLQAVYSGDAASALVREVLLVDEVEALEESAVNAWRRVEHLDGLAGQASALERELAEQRDTEQALRDKLRDTTLQLARAQADGDRLQREADKASKQAVEALDFAQEAEKLRRELATATNRENTRRDFDLKILLVEFAKFEKQMADHVASLNWKIARLQGQVGKAKASGNGVSAAARALGGRQRSQPDLSLGAGVGTKLDKILGPAKDQEYSEAGDGAKAAATAASRFRSALKKGRAGGVAGVAQAAKEAADEEPEAWPMRERTKVNITPAPAAAPPRGLY